ncbi:uncharacterized protein SCDLUD_004463 [Saccharomycodes ludwigii]|uniref:uncharacterized protein n=1 Tax=Saccharomycodes ludwigii TaxID=36035 RepID=UPI001E84177E|nr:hypothetical protein SCDLUD_004463 [Saccharomycodes ludwigii]KAH3899041.1 hypothetical protein SCDLUD_004463 [Saccharomycodes ludwigii]
MTITIKPIKIDNSTIQIGLNELPDDFIPPMSDSTIMKDEPLLDQNQQQKQNILDTLQEWISNIDETSLTNGIDGDTTSLGFRTSFIDWFNQEYKLNTIPQGYFDSSLLPKVKNKKK